MGNFNPKSLISIRNTPMWMHLIAYITIPFNILAYLYRVLVMVNSAK